MAATRSKCVKCGSKFDGRGSYCLQCVASASTLIDATAKNRRNLGARPKAPKDDGGPLCPHCKSSLNWDNLGYSETEVSIYVREKMYFCTGCRAVLGFSSWHTEG